MVQTITNRAFYPKCPKSNSRKPGNPTMTKMSKRSTKWIEKWAKTTFYRPKSSRPGKWLISSTNLARVNFCLSLLRRRHMVESSVTSTLLKCITSGRPPKTIILRTNACHTCTNSLIRTNRIRWISLRYKWTLRRLRTSRMCISSESRNRKLLILICILWRIRRRHPNKTAHSPMFKQDTGSMISWRAHAETRH